MKRLAAALVLALLPLAAAAPAEAARGGARVVVKHQRVCYTLAGVKRCHVQQVRVVRYRTTTWSLR